jgi:hypothetical protein
VRRLPESSNSYMWSRSTFLSNPTTFLTFKRTTSSCLHATEEIVYGPKSYPVDVLCVDYQSHLTVTCGYEVLFYLISLLSLIVRELYHLVFMPSRDSGRTQILSSGCIVCRLLESSNSYMWLLSTFLSHPTTFLTCRRTISCCLHATEEILDRHKSYQVYVLCVDYPSHLIVTFGYEVLFYLIPLLPLLVG